MKDKRNRHNSDIYEERGCTCRGGDMDADIAGVDTEVDCDAPDYAPDYDETRDASVSSVDNSADIDRGVDTKNGKTEVEEIAGRIGTVLDTVNKVRKFSWKDIIDGMFKIIFLIVCILGISFGWYAVKHTDDIIRYFIDRSTAIQTEQHDQRFFRRMEKSKTINLQLKNMLRDSEGVDRVYIIEFHNGSSNLVDLPFCHGTMTYEYFDDTKSNLNNIKDNWGNINLGNFFNEVCNNAKWMGDVEEVKNIDNIFYYKLKANDIEYLEMVALYNHNGKPIGVMGIGTESKNMSEDKANKNMRILIKYSQSISAELASGF